MSALSERDVFSVAPRLDETQLLVRDIFAQFFHAEVPSSRVRAADATHGFDRALWRAFEQMGGPVVSLPLSAGGGGGSLTDAALVGMECGRVLAPLPYAEVASTGPPFGKVGAGLRTR